MGLFIRCLCFSQYYALKTDFKKGIVTYQPGFEIVPIRVSETCQNLSGHVKCPCMVIRWTCPFFQLATRLTGVTRRHAPSRHRSRQCISCWRAARCSWSRSRYPPVFALLLDDNTRFSHDRRWDGACSRDASGRRFPNPSASRARRFCSS